MCTAGRNVVLATSVRLAGSQYVQVPSIYTAALASDPKGFSCVRSGYIQLPYDLRLVPGQLQLEDGHALDSLSLATVKEIDPTQYKIAVDHPERGFRYSRYLSEENFGPRDGKRYRFTWSELEIATPVDLRRDLADKVVLVGGAWHSNAMGQGQRVDTYNSPAGSMPGVFLHANYIEALDGERGTFAPISDTTAEIMELSLALALALIGSFEIHAGWKWGAFGASLAISVVLTYVLLENLGLFLDFLVPVFVLIVHTLVEEFLAMRHEIRRLRRLAAGGNL